MIGIQYYKYCPDQVSELPNSLRLYESQFDSHDRTRGVVGEQSYIPIFCNDIYDGSAQYVYFLDEVRLFVQGHLQGLDTGIRDVRGKEVRFSKTLSDENFIAGPGALGPICSLPAKETTVSFFFLRSDYQV